MKESFSGTLYIPVSDTDTEEDKKLKKEFAEYLFKDYINIKIEFGNYSADLRLEVNGITYKL